ncbi:DUF4012 domain-containing protein [Microbacterium sp. BWR-S6Y]|uniref:DUF4012 domain-containing protein n=1 Tax=Microbacterium sp. BWR-S6Y TaxID=3232073 RepID=UPI00352881B6
MTRSSSAPRRVRTATVFASAVLGVFVLGAGLAAWIGVRGAVAVQHLRSAEATVAAATADAQDPAGAIERLSDAAADTSAARSLTDDPIWSAAQALPWIGPQLAALSVTAAAVDDVASEAAPPLRTAAQLLAPDALRGPDGAIDVARVASAAPAVSDAAGVLQGAADRVSAIDAAPLLGSLASAVSSTSATLERAAADSDALRRATILFPRMLGADGPRSTLLLFQNNAEWRSLGGVVGAVAQVDSTEGHLALTAQASSGDFAAFAHDPALTLPDDVRGIFDTRPARYLQNTTQIPDFALGAQIAREMWRRTHGVDVDAVVAVDPVTLSYLLRATGPVTLPTGDELTADNAVPLLLDEVYRRFSDPRAQDAFFQSASSAVFQALVEGRGDPAALVDALTRAGAERRVLVWNADAADQSVLDGSTLQGALPASDGERTTIGVYLDDGTGSKMDYYLHPDIEAGWCGDDRVVVRVALRNGAPDPATLPAYVTGGGDYGVPVGDALTGVYVYLPRGAEVTARRTTSDDDTPSGFADGTHDGLPVVKWSVQLAPGRSGVLELDVRIPTTPRLDVVSTPTSDPTEVARTGACPTLEGAG